LNNDDGDVHRLIERGLEFTNRALELCGRLPELRIGTPTSINLGTLGADSIKVKQEISRELEILQNTFDRLLLRARLPIVVGVIGRFSGGKSSLLNSFFRKLFPDGLPAGLLRVAENTATDLRLTYITHTDFVSQAQQTPDIEIRSFKHEVLRRINFIDTPGTGWKAFNKKEVIDLVSSADILLFVSKPFDLLDDDSVEILNQKFISFKETPMWYVVTFASTYPRSPVNGETPDEDKFKDDLSEAKRKLKDKPCDSAAKLSSRDCVAENVEFKAGENTFLVDSISGFGTSELLANIISTFDSSEARITKHRILGMEVEIAYESLLRTLEQTAEHITAINKTLSLAYRRSIHPEIEKFIGTGLVAEVTDITHSLYSCISEARTNTDQFFRSEPPVPTVSYSTESAEVTILESELQDLKDRKRAHSYAYRATNILFDVTLLRSRMESIKLNAELTVSGVLDELWSKRSTGSRTFSPTSINSLVKETVEQETIKIEKAAEEKTDRNQKILDDYLRVPAQRLRNRYSSVDKRGTIFARQNGLLNAMGRDIPAACDELYKRLQAVCETTQDVRSNLTSKFNAVIESRIPTFAGSAAGLLHDCVYIPTQEALMLVLGDEELIEAKLPGKPQTEQELCKVGLNLAELVRHDDAELEQALIEVGENAKSELLAARGQWNTEWNDLKGQFDVLTESATEITVTLDEGIRDLANLLKSERDEGSHKIHLKLREAATEIGNVARQKSDQVNRSIADARSKASMKYKLQILGLILTAITSGIGLWKAWPTNTGGGSRAPLLIIGGMGLAIAVWIVKQLESRREQEQRTVDTEFNKSVDGLRQAVREAASGKIDELCNEVEARNGSLAEGLDRVYGATIDTCEKGNYRIIPNLMSEIERAAHLAMLTQKRIAMTAGAGIARLTQCLSNGVEKTAREVSEKMRNQFAAIIRTSGERCAETIRTQVQTHRNLASDVQQLIVALRNARIQRKSSPERLSPPRT
jgi:hypothetical protein